MNMKNKTDLAVAKIVTLASGAAKEDAMGDFKFSGESALKKLNLSQSDFENIREALLFYAESAAIRTVRTLKLHGLLNLNQ